MILLWALFAWSQLFAQKYKAAYRYDPQEIPEWLSATAVSPIPNSSDVAVLAEYKGPAPQHASMALVLRLNAKGQVLQSFGLGDLTGTTMDGVRGLDISVDNEGNFYVAGGKASSFAGMAPGYIRTVSKLSNKGVLNWSRSAGDFNFSSIYLEPSSGHTLALGGPGGGNVPQSDIEVQRFDATGALFQSVAFPTLTRDEPVEVFRAGDYGYVVVARSDLDGQPKVTVRLLDLNLNQLWAYAYGDAGVSYRATGAAYLSSGSLAITGRMLPNGSISSSTFVLLLNPADGSIQSLTNYAATGAGTLLANAVTAYTSGQAGFEEGLLIGGELQDLQQPNQRRPFLMNLAAGGSVRWAGKMAYLPPADLTFDELIKDVAYLPQTASFIAVGHQTVSVYNQAKVGQYLTSVQGKIMSPELDPAGNCTEALTVVSRPASLSRQALGLPVVGSSAGVFALPVHPPTFDIDYCVLNVSQVLPQIGVTKPRMLQAIRVSRGMLRLSVPEKPGTPGTVTITTLAGQVLHRQIVPAHEASPELQVSGLPQGMYLLRAEYDQMTYTGKTIWQE